MGEQVIIYWKSIQLDVTFPQENIGPFVVTFGEEFGQHHPYSPKPVDKVFFQGSWHILVSVHISQEEQFYAFLRRFCEEQGLSVREEDLQPGHP